MSIFPEAVQLWLQSLPFTFLPGLLLFFALPLAFLVLLLRKQRLDVGSLLLFRDLPQRTLFQNVHFEHLWHRWIYVLIFAVLALIAAGLSFSRPGQRHLIVLDDSASMASWVDPLNQSQGTLWELAKDRARAVSAQSDGLGRAVALIRLSDFSLFMSSPDQSKGKVTSNIANALESNGLQGQLAALGAAEVHLLPVSIIKRLEALGSLASGNGIGRITIITDHPLSKEAQETQKKRGQKIDWIDVSNAIPGINLAITEVVEKQSTFDRASSVVLQNVSNVPVSGAVLSIRSIKNPVELPILSDIRLAPNERLELAIHSLQRRAEVLGAGPLLLNFTHPADALRLDNQLWLVKPSTPQMQVALMQCQGTSPLFDRLSSVEGIRWSYFGDVTALEETNKEGDALGNSSERERAENKGSLILGEDGLGVKGSRFESFDLVIYDRCDVSFLYEELETDSIVIEAVVNQDGDPNAVDEKAAESVFRVAWQAPSSRSPVMRGVRSLIGMPLPSQTVRPLPQVHETVGLLSDLDPAMIADGAQADFFAPTDLLQSFVAWNGTKEVLDEETNTYVAAPPDPSAPKMLYLGFDPHIACLTDAVNEKPEKMPLAEALAATQNGPDNCLAMMLMIVNTIDWMRAESSKTFNDLEANGQFRRQYLGTGETLSVQSVANNVEQLVTREQLQSLEVLQGEAGARRQLWPPLALETLDKDKERAKGEVDRAGEYPSVRWLLDQPGLYQYSGTRTSFDLSVGLLNVNESRLDRLPVSRLPEIHAPKAGAGRQDLITLLVLLLAALMFVEVMILLFRGRGMFDRKRQQTASSTVENRGPQPTGARP